MYSIRTAARLLRRIMTGGKRSSPRTHETADAVRIPTVPVLGILNPGEKERYRDTCSYTGPWSRRPDRCVSRGRRGRRRRSARFAQRRGCGDLFRSGRFRGLTAGDVTRVDRARVYPHPAFVEGIRPSVKSRFCRWAS